VIGPEDIQATLAAHARHRGNVSAMARELGITRASVRARLKTMAKHGLLGTAPVLPGFEISRTSSTLDAAGNVVRTSVQQRPEAGPAFTVPEGHAVKGVSALLNAEGREIARWVKTREGGDPVDVLEHLKRGLAGYEGAAAPRPAPAGCREDALSLLPIADWHLGLYTWRRETGENWDLRIAEERYTATVDQLLARTPPAGTAIVLGGGDLVHSDNFDNRTARSGHALDVDGRYPKVVETAGRMMVRTVDRCLGTHERVLVRLLPGNHDEHTAIAISYFLLAWFKAEPRVSVDTDPSLFWWFRFGRTFLGGTHGHTVKPEQMPGIMAARRPQDWGESRFRYIHTFHRHHKGRLTNEAGGALVHVHRSPAPQDTWHFGAGFLSGRSMETITYHRELGEQGASYAPLGAAE